MERQKSPKEDWRITQQRWAKDPVEFIQDQRIIDFIKGGLTKGIGDIKYFENQLMADDDIRPHTQFLCIINTDKISKAQLIKKLQEISKEKNIFIAINKFYIYTESNDPTVIDDYDQAIFDLVKNIFNSHHIQYYFEKGVTGDSFNFASPTTQFNIKKK